MKKVLFFILTLGALSVINAKPEATTRTSTDGKFTIVESEDGSISIIDTQTGKISTVPRKIGTKTYTWAELLGANEKDNEKKERKPSILEELFGKGKQTTQESKQIEEKPSIWSELFGTKPQQTEKAEKPAQEEDYPKTLGGWLEYLTKKK